MSGVRVGVSGCERVGRILEILAYALSSISVFFRLASCSPSPLLCRSWKEKFSGV